MGNQEQVLLLVSNAYDSLRNIDLEAAAGFLDQALRVDFEHPEVLYALKCLRFWQDRIPRVMAVSEPCARGDMAIQQWKAFIAFLARLPGDFEAARYAFRRYLFGLALESYNAMSDEEKTARAAELDLRMGRCRKASGDYLSAIRHLERALKSRREDPELMAELADCHALSGEQRMSKAMFREAFFLGAARIDLDLIECDMICALRARLVDMGYQGAALSEWLPVYGNLWGLFSVKREMNQAEAARLNSLVFEAESELRDNPKDAAILMPRLVNRYFWQLDHLLAIGAERNRIDSVLLKIRLQDPVIYRQYTA